MLDLPAGHKFSSFEWRVRFAGPFRVKNGLQPNQTSSRLRWLPYPLSSSMTVSWHSTRKKRCLQNGQPFTHLVLVQHCTHFVQVWPCTQQRSVRIPWLMSAFQSTITQSPVTQFVTPVSFHVSSKRRKVDLEQVAYVKNSVIPLRRCRCCRPLRRNCRYP